MDIDQVMIVIAGEEVILTPMPFVQDAPFVRPYEGEVTLYQVKLKDHNVSLYDRETRTEWSSRKEKDESGKVKQPYLINEVPLTEFVLQRAGHEETKPLLIGRKAGKKKFTFWGRVNSLEGVYTPKEVAKLKKEGVDVTVKKITSKEEMEKERANLVR